MDTNDPETVFYTYDADGVINKDYPKRVSYIYNADGVLVDVRPSIDGDLGEPLTLSIEADPVPIILNLDGSMVADAAVAEPSCQDRFQYTGRELVTDDALHFNRMRCYDPTAGRWISSDALGFGASDLNFYRYVGD